MYINYKAQTSLNHAMTTLQQSMKRTSFSGRLSPPKYLQKSLYYVLAGRNMLVRESVFLKLIKDIFCSCLWNFLLGSQKTQQRTVNNCNQTSNQTNNTQGTKKKAKMWDLKEFEVSQTQQIPPENFPKHGLTLLKFILLPPRSPRCRFCPILLAFVKKWTKS